MQYVKKPLLVLPRDMGQLSPSLHIWDHPGSDQVIAHLARRRHPLAGSQSVFPAAARRSLFKGKAPPTALHELRTKVLQVTSKDLDLPPALADLLQPHWPPWGFHHLPSTMGFRVFDLALSPSGIPFPRDPWLAPSLSSGFCSDITFSERPSWRKDNFLFLPSCFMFLHNSGYYLFVQSLHLFSGGQFPGGQITRHFLWFITISYA